ncbi:DUF4350 domain-containing protein [Pseudoteredinibacter isoporae]|uniref:Uncharacterized protein (DUF2249 family) n=1 Tax=Pseudoteredinibacter isoporae TaxID=570281 RepID=A0A7X0JWQ9_9GAMM|nr:DUF4350 domain-containing protein [Pseudoteredinibacter isoporae]MBB6523655.1 uncharacterized protein (DUF2249 family) [Pseudoteredinibacter isoporae]NHO89159.1 DUF4350 domain-containing protein [Pseudoteredinibacter isoporae]NIB22230.1 DUF4350 domain-containing protein [Pseudoteredinibacter isoporae]
MKTTSTSLPMAWLILLSVCLPGALFAQQLVDDSFQPKNQRDYFPDKPGPLVLIDSAHHNFHQLDGRYRPFAKVLSSAGFRVQNHSTAFTEKGLAKTDILVIANALNPRNARNWNLPNFPAFTRAEIEVVFAWVKEGGSLMLIADHMPFPKAAGDLAELFGFQFLNAYVEVRGQREQYFDTKGGGLSDHPITRGVSSEKAVSRVRGFMGQAFLIPPQARPLMSFTQPSIAYMPSKSWVFDEDTPIIPVTGWHQAATLEFGKGRVAVFGEAGMFTAQVQKDGDELWKMGLDAKGAEQNEQFLINSLLWLAKKL